MPVVYRAKFLLLGAQRHAVLKIEGGEFSDKTIRVEIDVGIKLTSFRGTLRLHEDRPFCSPASSQHYQWQDGVIMNPK
jgi:hypothetical protein